MSWIKSIPQGTHGSTLIQKKFWKITSDYVRIRDFYLFRSCTSCGKYFQDWKDSQAGHYKAWGSCRGYSKFHVDNIFAQCAVCNSSGSSSFVSPKDTNVIGGNFKDNIRKRYGPKRIKFIESLDSYPTEKMDDVKCERLAKELLIKMGKLQEQPDYYQKVINQL